MTPTSETPPGMGGLADCSFPGGNVRETAPNSAADQAEILRNPRAVAEARLELLREAIFDACSFIQLHADACQTVAKAHDDAGLLHSLGRLVIYAQHAARAGNDLRASREAGQ